MNNATHIVAFTGHRTYDGKANELLRATIGELYNKGARHFRVGMAQGFDLAAGEAVVALMHSKEDIILEACIPWPEFNIRFDTASRDRYREVLAHATIVRYAADKYQPAIFHLRNDMLVEGAHTLVAWWDGGKSGTCYTVKRARKLGLIIKNLYPKNQLSIEFTH